MASEEIATYRILKQRSQAAAEQCLDGFERVIMTDGCGAYLALARARPDLQLAHSRAHVCMESLEGDDAYPELDKQALDEIGKLVENERELPRVRPSASDRARASILELRRRIGRRGPSGLSKTCSPGRSSTAARCCRGRRWVGPSSTCSICGRG